VTITKSHLRPPLNKNSREKVRLIMTRALSKKMRRLGMLDIYFEDSEREKIREREKGRERKREKV
jgi:hypothetical protein